MSWIQNCYETYNFCESWVGKDGEAGERPLAPICHISKKAHIEITIDQDGNFLDANLVTREKNPITIVPCTEDSASKAGITPEGHPLCEELQYVAGDFAKYGGKVTSGFDIEHGEPFCNYEARLAEWCESEFAHPKAQAVLKYVKKKKVVKDLVERQLLFVGSDGKFLAKKDVKRDKSKNDIFSLGLGSQDKTFIRWIIRSDEVGIEETWKDKTLWNNWRDFYLNLGAKGEKRLCMVTGEVAITSNKHPKYIRTSSDGAKLISSNDKSGFTYRGRFEDDDQQAYTVSLEVSQKAHNALLWLIDRQGKVFFEADSKTKKKSPRLTVLAWAVLDMKMPQPISDSSEIIDELELPTTRQEFALKFKNKLLGYSTEIGETKGIQVIAMDSASKGRLAITYYRELKGSEYLDRLERWHDGCSWLQHGYEEKTKKYFQFFGAPSPLNIAEAAYGKKADDKLKNATIARLIPCVIDGQIIPYDLVESVVRRASNRIGFGDSGKKKVKYENEWEQTLSIACALFKKIKEEKEKYDMSLDTSTTSRDYLYGRLLAIAERLEESALYKAEKQRATSAARYMQQFSQRPFSTWRQIHDLLGPYILQLGGATYYKDQIGEVECLFDPKDFTSDKPLTGEYLLGYYCQRQELRPKKKIAPPSETSLSDESENN